mgnify:CR=1 FL=1
MSATEEAIRIARLAARAAYDKKGLDIVACDVSEPLAIADIFLIVSANNERLVGAIVDAIEEKLIEVDKLRPLRREGDRENRWVLLDYGDVVVHVQHSEERELYAAAAEVEGLAEAQWVRQTLNKAARKVVS